MNEEDKNAECPNGWNPGTHFKSPEQVLGQN
jgi:hypothetical protein